MDVAQIGIRVELLTAGEHLRVRSPQICDAVHITISVTHVLWLTTLLGLDTQWNAFTTTEIPA